jgi:transposase
MSVKHRKRYTPEFKTQAVELLRTGKSASRLAEELCINPNLLHKWKQSTQVVRDGPRAEGEGGGADDLRALRREIALLRAENDILKKAAVILGTKHPLPSEP